jgi:formylmethanofuran dehydrogenase subunit C
MLSIGRDYLCCLLEAPKEVYIKGNVGQSFGWGLKGAKLVVEGNAGGSTGSHATAGAIHVKGSTGGMTGCYLQGATLAADGNAGENTGWKAVAGTVHVKGNTGNGTGSYLNGANIIVDADAGNDTGKGATSGVIEVRGRIMGLCRIRGLSPRRGGLLKISEAGKPVL